MKQLLCMVLTVVLLAGLAAVALADSQIPAAVLAGPAPGNFGIGGMPELAKAVRSSPPQTLPASQRSGGSGGQGNAVVFTAENSGQPQDVLRVKDAYSAIEDTVWMDTVPYDFYASMNTGAPAVAALLSRCTAARETEGDFVVWRFYDDGGDEYNAFSFAEYLWMMTGATVSVAACDHLTSDCAYCELVPGR